MAKYPAAEKTKNKIINATGTLVAEVGFANVSTRAIAKRAGENIGSIHYHFGGKEALFAAVIRSIISTFPPVLDGTDVKVLDKGDVSPVVLSGFIRKYVHCQISRMFALDIPPWHCQMVYQLLQYKGPLYDIFEREVLEPDDAVIQKIIRAVYPEISREDIVLRGLIIITPLIVHANYMSFILQRLRRKSYSPEYLQKLEDLVVRQTLLLMALPEGLPLGN